MSMQEGIDAMDAYFSGDDVAFHEIIERRRARREFKSSDIIDEQIE